MLITKTMFLNLSRCRRYPALEKIYNDKLDSKLTAKEYIKMEQEDVLSDILEKMFGDNGETEIDLTIKNDPQLAAMLDYYKEIEVIAAKRVEELFGGETIFGLDTLDQKSFNFATNDHDYLCYVDIHNETATEINIIEVKATTSKRYLEATFGPNKEPLFIADKSGIYHLNYLEDVNGFTNKYNNLQDRYHKLGKYIYDLAVQRYFIEQSGQTKPVNYYLAVLNHKYVYDGYRENNQRVYLPDENGEQIITLFELNDITKTMMMKIKKDIESLEHNIALNDNSWCKVGKYCGLKTTNECKYKNICYEKVPKDNNSYSFMNFKSFAIDKDTKLDKYGLVNEGYYHLLDVPEHWLKQENHKIQYNSTLTNKPYVNHNKLKTIIQNLEYPIYHLDFEGFPCPLPRFKGEKCYTQSPFQFSLHIERKPGVCDEIEDNVMFLADTFEDERESLAKALVENIDPNQGTILAQYIPYEYGRIKELAALYPHYRDQLLKMNERTFDLLYIIKNKKEYFRSLGFDEYDIETVNYYHPNLSGSYSIKKTLPVLVPHLSYNDLEVKNGSEAILSYANYNMLSEPELAKVKAGLISYCRQDTYAMVEILRKLRDLVK